MLLSRTLEERLAGLYRAGGRIVGGVYLGKGQEAFSAALAITLIRGRDVFGPLIRDQAGRIAFGEPLIDTTRTYLGSVLGPMRGRDGNIHRGRPRDGMPAMISHLGSMVSVVAGMLLARRMKGITGCAGGTAIGDGGTSTGAFHEGLNTAAVEKLPLVVAVANNQYAYSTPTDRQFVCEDLADKAIGYGVEGYRIDGTDLMECLLTFDKAVRKAREGNGPQLVVGKLLRLNGHGEHDDGSYVLDSLRQAHHGRDCVLVARDQAYAENWLNEERWEEMLNEAREAVDEAVSTAATEPPPDPYTENWHALSRQDLTEGYHGA